jgi:hypothetical protein
MKKITSHEEATTEIIHFTGDLEDSGAAFCESMNELAAALPEDPFSSEQLEMFFGPEAIDPETAATILTKAGHVEILPYLSRHFKEEKETMIQLSYAAMLAQLGDEYGYQILEDFFAKFMKSDTDFEDLDFENFEYVFEEILTNERGQELRSRFRKEADYHVEWHTVEHPDVE